MSSLGANSAYPTANMNKTLYLNEEVTLIN